MRKGTLLPWAGQKARQARNLDASRQTPSIRSLMTAGHFADPALDEQEFTNSVQPAIGLLEGQKAGAEYAFGQFRVDDRRVTHRRARRKSLSARVAPGSCGCGRRQHQCHYKSLMSAVVSFLLHVCSVGLGAIRPDEKVMLRPPRAGSTQSLSPCHPDIRNVTGSQDRAIRRMIVRDSTVRDSTIHYESCCSSLVQKFRRAHSFGVMTIVTSLPVSVVVTLTRPSLLS